MPCLLLLIFFYFSPDILFTVAAWKYNIRRNVNSDLSIVIMCRVALTVFELGNCKIIHEKIFIARHFMITFLFKKLRLIATVSIINESFK